MSLIEGSLPVAAEPSANTATQPDRRAAAQRRRTWRRILVASLVVVLLMLGGTIGVGYYFSGGLLTVDNSVSYPVTVKAINGNEVTLSRDEETQRPVVLGLAWDGGSAILSKSVRVNGEDVVRNVTRIVSGSLRAGMSATIDSRVFGQDPTSRELSFDEVFVRGELGDMPAWYVPPTAAAVSSTWVIAIHGRAASRTETLRILPAIAAAGMPALAISYRNDVGTPGSPDGYYHLGDTEWRDVVAAIDYARAHGATGVVLYGWSMGGGLTLTALRRMPPTDVAFVEAVVLDSASIDWTTILDFQGGKRGLPGFVTWTAERIIEWRAGLALADVDQRPYAPHIKMPMLVFIDQDDQTVPTGPAIEFARSRPDLVTLVTTAGGGHTASWNVDPQRYESTVSTFLARFTGI
jgi:pimeloyl-ACP methyl ester carboxylesterase